MAGSGRVAESGIVFGDVARPAGPKFTGGPTIDVRVRGSIVL